MRMFNLIKHQKTNYKLQINSNNQFRMTKTSKAKVFINLKLVFLFNNDVKIYSSGALSPDFWLVNPACSRQGFMAKK